MRCTSVLLILLLASVPCAGSEEVLPQGEDDLLEEIDAAIKEAELVRAWDLYVSGMLESWYISDVSEKLLLLDKGIEICLMSDNPRLAHKISQAGEAYGLWETAGWQTKGMLRQAEIQFALQNYSAMNESLEQVSNLLSENTSETELATLFALKALYAWLTHQYTLADEFIETVLFDTEDEVAGRPRAIALVTLALLIEEQGKDHSLIESNLLLAQKLMEKDAGIIAFYSFLETVMLLHPGQSIRSSNMVLLEFASKGERYPCYSISTTGLVSRAELLRREGNYVSSIEHLQRAHAMNMRSLEEKERQEDEWKVLSTGLFGKSLSGHKEVSNFLIILILLLAVLVLVMILRIRTQWIINKKLVESVERSRIAEETAEHANKLQSQFVANVSHEIKTPMSGLVGMTSLLEELVVDPVQRKYLSTIRVCCRNLLVIMNDLLDLGRIEANRLDIESRPFLTEETVKYCEQVVQMNALDKGLELIVETSDSLPEKVTGDSTRISQILVNLLNNAIKYTDKGMVRMFVDFEVMDKESGRLIATVEDTGPGIEQIRLQTVFEPFNQNTPEQSRSATGSGLGLAISKRLTEHMGGLLSVESDKGKGSKFTLYLPVGLPD